MPKHGIVVEECLAEDFPLKIDQSTNMTKFISCASRWDQVQVQVCISKKSLTWPAAGSARACEIITSTRPQFELTFSTVGAEALKLEVEVWNRAHEPNSKAQLAVTSTSTSHNYLIWRSQFTIRGQVEAQVGLKLGMFEIP